MRFSDMIIYSVLTYCSTCSGLKLELNNEDPSKIKYIIKFICLFLYFIYLDLSLLLSYHPLLTNCAVPFATQNFDTSFNPESFGYVHIQKVDGLWAKAELENFLQPSVAPETSLPEKFRSGSDLRMIPVMADKNSLNLPMSDKGVWPAEALHRLLGTSQFAVTEGSCSSSTYEVCHGNRVPLHNAGFNPSSTCSLDPSGQPHPEPLNDNTVSQMLPNSDMRSPNNEEAYVTMSNFYKIQ